MLSSVRDELDSEEELDELDELVSELSEAVVILGGDAHLNCRSVNKCSNTAITRS